MKLNFPKVAYHKWFVYFLLQFIWILGLRSPVYLKHALKFCYYHSRNWTPPILILPLGTNKLILGGADLKLTIKVKVYSCWSVSNVFCSLVLSSTTNWKGKQHKQRQFAKLFLKLICRLIKCLNIHQIYSFYTYSKLKRSINNNTRKARHIFHATDSRKLRVCLC